MKKASRKPTLEPLNFQEVKNGDPAILKEDGKLREVTIAANTETPFFNMDTHILVAYIDKPLELKVPRTLVFKPFPVAAQPFA